MRTLILAIAIASLFTGPIGFAHGRHGGNAHVASLGKSSALAGFNNDGAASVSDGNKSDAKPTTDAAPALHAPDADKPHRKSGHARDEEEVMQAEH